MRCQVAPFFGVRQRASRTSSGDVDETTSYYWSSPITNSTFVCDNIVVDEVKIDRYDSTDYMSCHNTIHAKLIQHCLSKIIDEYSKQGWND